MGGLPGLNVASIVEALIATCTECTAPTYQVQLRDISVGAKATVRNAHAVHVHAQTRRNRKCLPHGSVPVVH
jgi:L-asparaginase II